MGREIEKAALARGHEIVARIDTAGDWIALDKSIRLADVVVEFSTPATVVENIRRCFDMNLPVVVGTTGWNESRDKVRQWCREENQAIFAASNFSIGVNILFSLTRQLAEAMDRFEGYDISLEEIHHVHKLDSPSGTAISLAEIILERVARKKHLVNHPPENQEELGIISKREDEIPGIHTICCESDADRLIIRHEAKGRKGFSAGAIMAAEWLPGRQGYFEMKDLFQ